MPGTEVYIVLSIKQILDRIIFYDNKLSQGWFLLMLTNI